MNEARATIFAANQVQELIQAMDLARAALVGCAPAEVNTLSKISRTLPIHTQPASWTAEEASNMRHGLLVLKYLLGYSRHNLELLTRRTESDICLRHLGTPYGGPRKWDPSIPPGQSLHPLYARTSPRYPR